jgi:hypothetical protein
MIKISRLSSSLSAIVMILAISSKIAGTALAAEPSRRISEASKTVRDKIDLKASDGCSHIYGFNYQPSWGSNGLSVWGEKFDPKKYREELGAGKRHFPKFNAVRIWLSWSAYRKAPEPFIRNFQQAVDICGELDLLVIPVMFNRWPGGWDEVANLELLAPDFDAVFGPYIRALVTPLKGDLRILAWDLCNEPYAQSPMPDEVCMPWLFKIREAVKQGDRAAWVCIGNHDQRTTERSAPLQDILTPHIYLPSYSSEYREQAKIPAPLPKNADGIDKVVELAKALRKPVICTECCWGAWDTGDAERVRYIRFNLQALKERGIGFMPHALWTSGVMDLHKGGLNMPFILEDGSLRPGHEVYNEFAQ